VCGYTLGLDELFFERLQVLIIELELELERTIGDPPAGPQQGHDLIKDLIKVHHRPSESVSSSAIGTLEQFALAATKISGAPLHKSPGLRAAPFDKGGFRGFCVYQSGEV